MIRRNQMNGSPSKDRIKVKVVDCDVHPVPESLEAFTEFYPEPYRSRYFTKHATEVPLSFFLYTPHPNLVSYGMQGPGGYATPPGKMGGSGSDPDYLAKQLCVDHSTDYCLFNPLFFRARHWDPQWDSAHCSAINNWLAKCWLEGKANAHGRFYGSIQVSAMDPEGAVREIEKWAGHPAFKQIYFLADSGIPFGHPSLEPVMRAASKHNFPIGTHLFRHAGLRSMTPVGFPSYHVEVLPEWIFTYIGHVSSMVFGGVFERYPNLKLVCIEGGAEWAGPMIWRMDRHWEQLGAEIPHLKRKPSEVIREHVRFATQPLCEPEGQGDLRRFLEWGLAENCIVFSSDYPHYDFDPATWVANQLPSSWRDRLMAQNAIETYGLPAERPRDYLDDMDAGDHRMRAGEKRQLALAQLANGQLGVAGAQFDRTAIESSD
ncbi:amidohydrolase [Rhizobium tropici]|uniref:Amidohydrolase n=2 Tax=Rhizobium tropici TaxID=398 RepID=A0A5B0VS64_RHITR|nr:amidohydrolase [Rhizobium tropici]